VIFTGASALVAGREPPPGRRWKNDTPDDGTPHAQIELAASLFQGRRRRHDPAEIAPQFPPSVRYVAGLPGATETKRRLNAIRSPRRRARRQWRRSFNILPWQPIREPSASFRRVRRQLVACGVLTQLCTGEPRPAIHPPVDGVCASGRQAGKRPRSRPPWPC
jgi:hypothetical protein